MNMTEKEEETGMCVCYPYREERKYEIMESYYPHYFGKKKDAMNFYNKFKKYCKSIPERSDILGWKVEAKIVWMEG